MQATWNTADVNELKKAPAMEGVMDVFHERWSPRSFAEREVKADRT